MLFEDRSLAPYQGEEPYIFLSYSHRNADAAAETIRYLKAAGFRVWYDEGVIPATQWDENVAQAIENCNYFIALISEAYLSSANCLDELNYARDRGTPLLLIYLEDVSLPSGLAMRLGRLLAIHRYRYKSPAAFYGKVVRSKGISICGDRRFEEEEEDVDSDVFWLDNVRGTVQPEGHSVFRPIFLILLALVVAFVAFLLLRGWAGERLHGIFGTGDSGYSETLPAPDSTPYEAPDVSAEIEIETTPTPEPSVSLEPIPSSLPNASPSPTPTPSSAPTLTPSPEDTVTVVVPSLSPDATPEPTPSEAPVEETPAPISNISATDEEKKPEETPSEPSGSTDTPEASPTPTPTTTPETTF